MYGPHSSRRNYQLEISQKSIFTIKTDFGTRIYICTVLLCLVFLLLCVDLASAFALLEIRAWNLIPDLLVLILCDGFKLEKRD